MSNPADASPDECVGVFSDSLISLKQNKMKSRIVSLIIAALYLVFAYHAEGGGLVLRMTGFLLLPLACIWFSEEMGSYTGVGFGRGAITEPSSGCFVAFGGWLLLILPLISTLVTQCRYAMMSD